MLVELNKLIHILRRWLISSNSPQILIAVSIMVGIGVGFVSIVFKELTEWIQFLFFGTEEEALVSILRALPWYVVVFVPALGGLMVGILMHTYFRDVPKGGGVEQVMIAVATNRGRIGFKSVFSRLLTSSITLGTGGSAGREGPIVQIAGGIGSCIGRYLKLKDEHVKTLVGAGVASGIAAAFNAPIAGAFFAVEIILGDFALNTFSSIILASVAATVVSRSFFGNNPAFAPDIVLEYTLHAPYELILYLILGIIAGFLCSIFIKTLFASERFFHNLNVPEYIKPAIGGLMVGLLGLYVPEVMSVGYDTIEHVVQSKDMLVLTTPWFLLILILICKILATSWTLGSGGSGGTIVPSLFLGSVLGGILGVLFANLLPDGISNIETGAYALVGMAAVIAGTTQAPIMSIMLFFEATNNYHIILPVMTVCIASSLVTKYLVDGSLYTAKLKQLGLNYEDLEKTIMQEIKVKEVMKPNVFTFCLYTPLHKIFDDFLRNHYSMGFVVDDSNKVVGILHLNLIKRWLPFHHEKDFFIAEDLLTKENMFFVLPNDSLAHCMDILSQQRDIDILPVLQSYEDKTLLGYLSQRHLLFIYNQEVMKRDSSGVRLSSQLKHIDSKRYLQFSSEYSIDTIPVPSWILNKTIKQLDLRHHHQVTIIAIQKSYSEKHQLVQPNTLLQKGDYIVVSGDKPSMDKFMSIQ